MSILDQFREDKVAVENTGCTIQELNDVLSYLLCLKTKVNGVNYYYCNNQGMGSVFGTNYTRNPSYPVSDFLKAIEQETKENELKAKNAINETLTMLENEMKYEVFDLPTKVSISQHGLTHSIKSDTSEINIYEMKDILISLLKSVGYQDKSIKQIFKDDI